MLLSGWERCTRGEVMGTKELGNGCDGGWNRESTPVRHLQILEDDGVGRQLDRLMLYHLCERE